MPFGAAIVLLAQVSICKRKNSCKNRGPAYHGFSFFQKMKPSEVKWMLKNVAHSDSVRFFSDDDIYAYLNLLPNSALVTAEDLLEKPPVATHFMKVGPPVKFFADWLNG